MKLYVVSDWDCTYAIKLTIDEAREAARQVWMDVAYPHDWSVDIGVLDTDTTAPQGWPTVETMKFEQTWEDDEDDDDASTH